MRRYLFVTSVLLASFAACADIDDAVTKPILPKDYKSTFVEVRGCRSSLAHDGSFVIVKVPPAVRDLYDSGPFVFPVGTVIALEEYGDELCQNQHSWSVMRKEQSGYDPPRNDWHWQRIEAIDGSVSRDGKLKLCGGCHSACKPRDFTCSGS